MCNNRTAGLRLSLLYLLFDGGGSNVQTSSSYFWSIMFDLSTKDSPYFYSVKHLQRRSSSSPVVRHKIRIRCEKMCRRTRLSPTWTNQLFTAGTADATSKIWTSKGLEKILDLDPSHSDIMMSLEQLKHEFNLNRITF